MTDLFPNHGTLTVIIASTITDVAELVKELAPLVSAFGAVGAVYLGIINSRKIVNVNDKVATVVEKVEQVHVATNSMKDQLVAQVASAEHAKGVIAGRQEVKSEEGRDALAVQKAFTVPNVTAPAPTPVTIVNPSSDPVPVVDAHKETK